MAILLGSDSCRPYLVSGIGKRGLRAKPYGLRPRKRAGKLGEDRQVGTARRVGRFASDSASRTFRVRTALPDLGRDEVVDARRPEDAEARALGPAGAPVE